MRGDPRTPRGTPTTRGPPGASAFIRPDRTVTPSHSLLRTAPGNWRNPPLPTPPPPAPVRRGRVAGWEPRSLDSPGLLSVLGAPGPAARTAAFRRAAWGGLPSPGTPLCCWGRKADESRTKFSTKRAAVGATLEPRLSQDTSHTVSPHSGSQHHGQPWPEAGGSPRAQMSLGKEEPAAGRAGCLCSGGTQRGSPAGHWTDDHISCLRPR